MCVLLIITILAVCCHRLVLWKTFLSTFTMFRSNVSPAVRAYSLSCKVQVVVVYWFRRRCLCSVRHIWTLATISDYENTIAWSRQFREVSSAKYSGKHNKHTWYITNEQHHTNNKKRILKRRRTQTNNNNTQTKQQLMQNCCIDRSPTREVAPWSVS